MAGKGAKVRDDSDLTGDVVEDGVLGLWVVLWVKFVSTPVKYFDLFSGVVVGDAVVVLDTLSLAAII